MTTTHVLMTIPAREIKPGDMIPPNKTRSTMFEVLDCLKTVYGIEIVLRDCNVGSYRNEYTILWTEDRQVDVLVAYKD